jgi:hypothetical protein
MHIQVLFDIVSYEQVCEYYNDNKSNDWKPLRQLERAEGGFCIDIKNHPVDKNDIFANDPNAKIKQVRWVKKHLKTPIGWNGFNSDETMLLYESLRKIYGEDQVILHTE